MSEKKYLHPLGFLGTGVVGQSFLAGLPSLVPLLGPVYSPSKRATPRLVRSLGAGFPVATIKEVRKCHSLLVCAPPQETVDLLDLARSEGVLERVDIVALVEDSTQCAVDPQVQECVSEVGYVSKLPLRRDPAYLVEGGMRFRRFCQSLLQVPIRRLVLIPRESRAVMDAAMFMAEEFCLPLFEAVQTTITSTGIAPDHARDLAAEILLESLNSAHFAGRKRWTGVLHNEDADKLGKILGALQTENKCMATFAESYIQHALAVMGKSTDWMPGTPSSVENSADRIQPIPHPESFNGDAPEA